MLRCRCYDRLHGIERSDTSGDGALEAAMLTISKMGGGSAGYYLDLAHADFLTEGGEPPGLWLGSGARALGLQGEVGRAALEQLLAGKHPATGEPLRQLQTYRNRSQQPGWDLTFSAPKGVSVLWAVASPDARAAIEEAHKDAVGSALLFFEVHAAYGRRGKNGSASVRVQPVFATFMHGTSRADDPQVHTHALLMNVGCGMDGAWRAIDSRGFYRASLAARQDYLKALAANLTASLGLECVPTKNGAFSVKGVPEAVETAFSRRKVAIESELRKQDRQGPKSAKMAALITRPEKTHAPRERLFQEWGVMASEHGFTTDHAHALIKTFPLPLIYPQSAKQAMDSKNEPQSAPGFDTFVQQIPEKLLPDYCETYLLAHLQALKQGTLMSWSQEERAAWVATPSKRSREEVIQVVGSLWTQFVRAAQRHSTLELTKQLGPDKEAEARAKGATLQFLDSASRNECNFIAGMVSRLCYLKPDEKHTNNSEKDAEPQPEHGQSRVGKNFILVESSPRPDGLHREPTPEERMHIRRHNAIVEQLNTLDKLYGPRSAGSTERGAPGDSAGAARPRQSEQQGTNDEDGEPRLSALAQRVCNVTQAIVGLEGNGDAKRLLRSTIKQLRRSGIEVIGYSGTLDGQETLKSFRLDVRTANSLREDMVSGVFDEVKKQKTNDTLIRALARGITTEVLHSMRMMGRAAIGKRTWRPGEEHAKPWWFKHERFPGLSKDFSHHIRMLWRVAKNQSTWRRGKQEQHWTMKEMHIPLLGHQGNYHVRMMVRASLGLTTWAYYDLGKTSQDVARFMIRWPWFDPKEVSQSVAAKVMSPFKRTPDSYWNGHEGAPVIVVADAHRMSNAAWEDLLNVAEYKKATLVLTGRDSREPGRVSTFHDVLDALETARNKAEQARHKEKEQEQTVAAEHNQQKPQHGMGR